MTDTQVRCGWCGTHTDYIHYHDNEWGVPIHEDRRLFELLCLEGAQAGLSWLTILRKREGYRTVFDQFDPTKVANYDAAQIKRLKQDKRIVRNELKIRAFVTNAQAYLRIIDSGVSFDNYLWQFVDGQPIQNRFRDASEVPAHTEISDAMSKQLKKDGFKFAGSTICYAFMQSAGMVNDHLVDCFRYSILSDQ